MKQASLHYNKPWICRLLSPAHCTYPHTHPFGDDRHLDLFKQTHRTRPMKRLSADNGPRATVAVERQEASTWESGLGLVEMSLASSHSPECTP